MVLEKTFIPRWHGSSQPQYVVVDQQQLTVDLKDTDPAETYKFYVKTSVGTCQAIHRFPLIC